MEESPETPKPEFASSAPKPTRPSYVKPLIGVAIAVALCGVSFYSGVQYQKSRPASALSSSSQSQTGRFGSGMMGQRGAFGTVSAISSTSITITEQRNNTSKTYTINSSTTIKNGSSAGSISDIASGDTVLITVSSSDSSAAATITVNPTMPSGGPGGFGGQDQSSTDSSGSDSSI